MSIHHHPHDDLLVAYAAGTLDEARDLLLATHLAICPQCRVAVTKAEMMGGDLLERIAPSAVSDDALDSVLARLDPSDLEPEPTASVRTAAPAGPGLLPNPLRDYLDNQPVDRLRWRWMGPGIRRHDLALRGKGPKPAQAFLLTLEPETVLPQHGHSGDEMTLVLAGGYSDGSGHYLYGDIQHLDSATQHQPIVDPGEQCVVLAVTDGPLRFTGWLPRLLQPILER